MTKRRKPLKIHPFIKQAIRARWNAEVVKAEIHSLIGDDREKLMAYASILFFVAGGCAAHMGWTGDEPDFRIIRGSVNALDDLAAHANITQQDRESLHAGMLAAQRVLEASPVEAIENAAYTYAHHSQQWAHINQPTKAAA